MDLNKYVNKYHNVNLKYKHKVSIITDIYQDIVENGVFVSIKGKNEEIYIKKAIENGAKSIFVEPHIKIKNNKINIIKVSSTKTELARLLKEENKDFTEKPTFIGITGTNGKTTSTYLLYSYLKYLNYDCLLIGTNWIYSYLKLNETYEETSNTTPSLSLLYKYLRNNHNEYDYVIMEVSSQGIEEGRTLGLTFDILGITNLSSDHLDYHHTISEYKIVKSKILKQLNDDGTVILNSDDLSLSYYKNQSIAKLLTFGIKNGMVKPKKIGLEQDNTFLQINNIRFKTNLIGIFNIYNILLFYAIHKTLKINDLCFQNFLNKQIIIPGRMNSFKIKGRTIIVDFAHTISSVESIFKTFKKLNYRNILTVIGCGGCRDKSKRQIIGKITTEYSNYVIFTEDNSREENTTDIIEDITKNLTTNNFNVILNRSDAIKKIFKLSSQGDLILILGKGTENYQIKANNVKVKYSDIEEVKRLNND